MNLRKVLYGTFIVDMFYPFDAHGQPLLASETDCFNSHESEDIDKKIYHAYLAT